MRDSCPHMKLVIESSVGWSKRSAGVTLALSRRANALANAPMANESKPLDISGTLISTAVPIMSCATN